MPRPALYIAVTNHGFGHAVRAASVAAEVQKLNPDILLVFVTTAPHWLIESYVPGEFIHRQRAYDVGVVQSDSINMDLETTLKQLQEIRQRQHSIVASEVDFIHLNRIGLMLADIPPLAAPIAKAAGIPCWMMSNFGWDFIYRPWGGAFEDVADWIADCFRQSDRLFRLPFHEPMSAFSHVTPAGLTGGTPRYDTDTLQAAFGITAPREQTILLSFGGLGLQKIPYHNLAAFPDWQFITFDRNAPDLPNLVRVPTFPLEKIHLYRPVDFMPLCDRVVSKPGYSTFAEAMRLSVPIVSIRREGFAESPILIEAIQDAGYSQILEQEEFFEGKWDFLRVSPNPPRQQEPVDKNGSEAIAREIVNFFAT